MIFKLSISMALTRPAFESPKRPARPAICLTSSDVNVLVVLPSNFVDVAKIILSAGKFSPIPIASVATKISVSPSQKRLDCSLLTFGDNAPYIMETLYPKLSIFSFIARAFFLEKTTTIVRGDNLFNFDILCSTTNGVKRSVFINLKSSLHSLQRRCNLFFIQIGPVI